MVLFAWGLLVTMLPSTAAKIKQITNCLFTKTKIVLYKFKKDYMNSVRK